jgi:hypothetical protein
MNVAGLCLGIISCAMMLLGLLPCFGGLNWLTIPLAILGTVFSSVGLSISDQWRRGSATAGLVLSIIALVFGSIRLILGGGVL